MWSQYGQGEIANLSLWSPRPTPAPMVWEATTTIKCKQQPTQAEWNEFRDFRLNVGLSQNNPVATVTGLSATPPQVGDIIPFKVAIDYNLTTAAFAGLKLRDGFPAEPWADLFDQLDAEIKVYTTDYGL